jgi:plasmid stability protein
MLKNTTFNLPEELVARAKAYAAAHGTTMTSIVREHLAAVTSAPGDAIAADPLVSYSRGLLARDEAIRLLGLRDYAELLVALGDADLPMPLPPPHEIENQATTFVKLWNQS